MRRSRSIAAACIALAVLGLAGCAVVPAAPVAPPVPVVVIVTDPITWSEVASGMPELRRLADGAALGLVVAKDPAASASTLSANGITGVQPISSTRVHGTPAEMDEAIASAVAEAPPGAAIVVASELTLTVPGRGASAGVALVSGGGYKAGLLTSISTRRRGLVTDSDVAATAARIAGASPGTPSAIVASVVDDHRTPAERIAWLQRVSIFLDATEKLRIPAVSVYGACMVLLLLGGWYFAERGRASAHFGYWSLVLRRLIILGLVLPPAATLLHVADRFPSSPPRLVALLLAASGFLWVFAEFAWQRWGTAGAVAFAGIAAALVLGGDQLTGASLSLSGIFSYSPLGAFRFFGIGNEGASILIGGALVGLSLEMDATGPEVRRRRLLIAAVGAACVLLCAAPFFGANVVVSLWGTVTFAAFWIAAEKRRVRVRDVVAVGALAVLAVATMVMLDRFTGGTHIGRAVGEAASGGLGALLAHRLQMSVRLLTGSVLPAIALALTAVLAYLRARPRGRMALVLAKYPYFAAAMSAGLIGGVLGTLAEDSGVIIIALVLTYLVGALVALMLEPEREAIA